MKKILFTLLLAAATLPGWADEWFINGDATPMGWSDDAAKHQVTAFIPQGNGTYVWIGKLVVGDQGFKIGKSADLGGWGDYHPSTGGLEIDKVDSDNIVSGGNDTKWKVSKEGVYKLTLTEGNPNTLKCEAYTPTITQEDGYYLINTAADLYEFAELVSHKGISAEANAKLTADIDYTAYHRSTIGRHRDIAWAGTFDGQGHKIKIALTDWMQRTGLFSYVYHPTIKDLWIDGTITMSSHNCAGGLGGRCDGDGPNIDGILSTVAITDNQSGDGTHGGLFANIESNNATISNCAFFGSINATSRNGNGGLVGWCGSGSNVTFKNCLIAPASISWDGGAIVGRNTPTVTNCYYYNISNKGDFHWAGAATLHEATNTTLGNGEVCYSLNENVTGAQHWYQTLSTDTKPYPIATGHSILYANGDLRCDGVTPKEGSSLTLSNTDGANIDPHSFEGGDGWCTFCGAYNPNAFTATDGWFEVSTAKQLRWMAESVNEHNSTYGNANIKLTANIDYSAYTDQAAMFGKPSNTFKGVFDGQCHTVTVAFNNTTAEETGLFRRINGGTVKNLKVAGTITTNQKLAGGICSGIWQKGTITNCESAVTITDTESGDGTHGGILACTHDENDNDNIYVLNCLFSGKLDASNRNGSAGIVGWTSNRNTVKVKNCLVTGTLTIADVNSNGVIVRSSCDGENNYYTCSAGSHLNKDYATEASAKKGTGELCYLLNGQVSGGTNWRQTIGTDAAPTPFNTSSVVYANGSFQCDGVTPTGDVTYANTENHTVADHSFGANNLCSACKAVGQEPDTSDGAYQIGTIGHLVWFSNNVNSGNTTANAVLTADIDQEVSTDVYAVYVPIGDEDNIYTGHFDGQGHTVNLHIDNPEKNFQGLFGVVTDGVKIEKVVVTGSIKGNNYVGGIVGGTKSGSGNAQKTNIWYCGNEATITAKGANGAGIIGVNMSGSASIILTNCYNTGNITSGSDGGALSGWLGGGWSNVRSCYNSGTIKNGENTSKAFGRNSGCYFTNCYYTASSGTDNSTENHDNGQITEAADATLASGELCYLLNGDQSQIAFYQSLGDTDTYPTIDFNKPKVYQLSVGEHGYASFVPTVNIASLPEGVTVFAGQNNGTSLHLEEVAEVPADNAFVVKAAEGNYYYNNTSASITLSVANDLTYSDEAIVSNGTQYCLANKASGVGFYKVQSEITIPARKAYLAVTAGGAKEFYGFDDDATGISDLNVNDNLNGAIYNLAGQRINKMQKGINIINGKKILF